jgi:hypothetical protein
MRTDGTYPGGEGFEAWSWAALPRLRTNGTTHSHLFLRDTFNLYLCLRLEREMIQVRGMERAWKVATVWVHGLRWTVKTIGQPSCSAGIWTQYRQDKMSDSNHGDHYNNCESGGSEGRKEGRKEGRTVKDNRKKLPALRNVACPVHLLHKQSNKSN